MNTRDLGYVALSTALLCISAWIAIPLAGIPITMQTLVLCLSSALLGWKKGLFAVLAYLLLGCIGAPVFAGFTGGVGVLLSPTGGYLIGFLPCAFVIGWAGDRLSNRKGWNTRLFLGLWMGLGVLLCYALGTAWFILLTAQESSRVGLWSALITCVLPYLPFDCVKIVCAVVIVGKLGKIIKIK